jgi:hypothetical protein
MHDNFEQISSISSRPVIDASPAGWLVSENGAPHEETQAPPEAHEAEAVLMNEINHRQSNGTRR